MRHFFQKPFRWMAVFALLLAFAVTFTLLDTFVIPRAGIPVSSITASSSADTVTSAGEETSAAASQKPVITSTSYQDDKIQISIETVHVYNTDVYIADIQVSSADFLKTAFAHDTYGRNIKDLTSNIATSHNAILAINGDYYGFRDYGYVLRNGVLYRDTAAQASSDEGLAIDQSGNFSIISESQTSAQLLVDANLSQVFSFGPALLNQGELVVDRHSEVGQASDSNPRAAIGQVSERHYVLIVSDGRTSKSTGLKLNELAQIFKDQGCKTAYNLDGGGSATLWFNGTIINKPTTNGQVIEERSVSDIVYFGY